MQTRRSQLRWALSALLLSSGVSGCTNITSAPNAALLGNPPYIYSDQDWAEVLRQHVRGGLVDYDALSVNREPLQRYYALLGVTGPGRTPDQFPTAEQRTAYWINAYNAAVLIAVLERYPVASMYDLSIPRLEHEYTFVVDGQVRNLAAIEEEILRSSQGDVRGLLATSRAAIGTPALASEPIRAGNLERQLAGAASSALDNPNVLRIDHGTQSILVWQVILRRQDDFIAYWRARRRVQTAYPFNVLLELASPAQRRALQSAVGYTIREVAFDRSLNICTPTAGTNAAGE